VFEKRAVATRLDVGMPTKTGIASGSARPG
jgi:hypothetical protein